MHNATALNVHFSGPKVILQEAIGFSWKDPSDGHRSVAAPEPSTLPRVRVARQAGAHTGEWVDGAAISVTDCVVGNPEFAASGRLLLALVWIDPTIIEGIELR